MDWPTLAFPLLLYQEQAENFGQWDRASSLELKIPSSWDLDGKVSDYQTFQLSTEAQQADLIRGVIVVEHSTDLHYCSSFKQFAKDPYRIEPPPGVDTSEYRFIFFKKQTPDEHLLLDIVGFNVGEKDLQRVITTILQKLLYESRYSKVGIQKQVEDQVERIFYGALKRILRLMAKIQGINYQNMYDLTRRVVHSQPVPLLDRDIQSIVYKTILTTGLFPIHCEINTMNDSYLKLKLLSFFTNSEILPWSPKFHASLALANYHYSFTPNDLFNLRTLNTRKFHKGYQYIRLRILDFFPLDRWVEQISAFFFENHLKIIDYIKQHVNDSSKEFKQKDLVRDFVDPLSFSKVNLLDLKEPFIKEEFKETEMMYDSRKPSRTSCKSIILEGSRLDKTEPFKNLLLRSIRSVTRTKEVYGITMKTFQVVEIKKSIATEFYQNYSSELERKSILDTFCSIITETELRSYSTFANNCQTPVAAFIYLLCDTFRPYSEVLYTKQLFLEQCHKHFAFELKRNHSNIESSYLKMLQDSRGPAQEQLSCNFDRVLSNYCKYGSTTNLFMMSLSFIQPAILKQCLDYFGFFSDQLSSEFLQKIQEIDGNPYEFNVKRQNQRNVALMEQQLFEEAFQQAQDRVLYSYKSIKNSNKSVLEQIKDLKGMLYKPNLREMRLDQLNLHYLMQHYQNMINRNKQDEVKDAQVRHQYYDLLDEAAFYYYNSIRMQVNMKNRKNTVSLIGFVIAKDLDRVNLEPPENVQLLKT